jgi:hypothetical protein
MADEYDWTLDDTLTSRQVDEHMRHLPRATVAITPTHRMNTTLRCDHMIAGGPLVRCRCYAGCEMQPYQPTV